MSASKVFVARLAGCSVFDPAGDRVGRVRDVLVVYRRVDAPQVVGLIVEVPGKRRIFVSIGRITSIGAGQVITTGLVNMRRFEQRGGEVRVIAEILGRKVLIKKEQIRATIEDVAIEDHGQGDWSIAQLFLRKPKTTPSPFGKGPTTFATWNEVTEDELPGESQSAEHVIAAYSDLVPADLASTLLDLPSERRFEVAEELPDNRLADVLEEMPDQERIEILSALRDARAADVLDQMQPDDAADLLAQLPDERSEALLELMEPEEAQDVRMLLEYEPDTAGGLMTTEPVILSADSTVAEGLALVRRHELAPVLGAAVCVTLPPYEPPTGRFLGLVHFQRMLRYPPNERLGTLIDQQTEPVKVDASAAEVTRVMATYNLLSVPVVDDAHRLVGVVTIDDVLDHVLPDDWRSQDAADANPGAASRPRTRTRRTAVPSGRRTNRGTPR